MATVLSSEGITAIHCINGQELSAIEQFSQYCDSIRMLDRIVNSWPEKNVDLAHNSIVLSEKARTYIVISLSQPEFSYELTYSNTRRQVTTDIERLDQFSKWIRGKLGNCTSHDELFIDSMRRI